MPVITRLDNGVRLICAPMRERASATVSFMFGVGSRWESGADEGLAHFIEHMVFKGGARFRTARAVSEAVESVGGVINASTDRESTVFWAKVPAERLGNALDVLADILMHPVFDPAEVAKERLVVVEEIRMYQDSPQDHVQTIFDEVMWPAHPLGRDIAGTEESVMGFDDAACHRHLRTHYRPEALVVSVAGAVDADAVTRLVADRLGAWRSGEATPSPPRPATPCDGSRLRVVNRRTEQASIVLGTRAPSYLDADRHVIDLLNCILGEGMSSRLFLEIRESQGLAYDVSSYAVKLRDSGALCIALGCEPGRAAAAIASAVTEMHKLADEAVPAKELAKVKEYTAGRLLVQLESTSARAGFYGQQELLTGEVEEPDSLIEQVNDISAADIQRVAAALLDSSNGGLRAAVVGPFRGSARMEKALAS